MAKRSRVRVVDHSDSGITIRMRDQSGHVIERRICLAKESLQIEDRSRGNWLKSYLHFECPVQIQSSAVQNATKSIYAPEFGSKKEISSTEFTAKNVLQYQVLLLPEMAETIEQKVSQT